MFIFIVIRLSPSFLRNVLICIAIQFSVNCIYESLFMYKYSIVLNVVSLFGFNCAKIFFCRVVQHNTER